MKLFNWQPPSDAARMRPQAEGHVDPKSSRVVHSISLTGDLANVVQTASSAINLITRQRCGVSTAHSEALLGAAQTALDRARILILQLTHASGLKAAPGADIKITDCIHDTKLFMRDFMQREVHFALSVTPAALPVTANTSYVIRDAILSILLDEGTMLSDRDLIAISAREIGSDALNHFLEIGISGQFSMARICRNTLPALRRRFQHAGGNVETENRTDGRIQVKLLVPTRRPIVGALERVPVD